MVNGQNTLLTVLVLCCVNEIICGNWYTDNWCGGNLEFLDDGKCAKVFPKTLNRSWECPIVTNNIPEDDYQDESSLIDVKVNTESLGSVVSDERINLCAIITKRVQNNDNTNTFEVFNKYLCAGDRSATQAFETWSSSKIFAMANAAGHLRSNETSCKSSVFGLDGTVTGKHGSTPLGDLSTVVCSYDHTAGYSSNSLSSYFHDLGWRDRLNSLLTDWLGVQGQTLGGNYGEATPSDLGLSVSEKNSETCHADKDPWPTIHDNTISALSAAEMTRRIVQHREVQEKRRFPGVTWTDIQNILYGAEHSALFPGLQWGGMSTDTAVFLQSALDLPSLLQRVDTRDQWRILSKLGAGYSNSRSVGEILSNSYACLPSYDQEGNINGGIEFSLTARGSVPFDSSLKEVERALHTAINQAVQYLLQYEWQK